MRHSSWNDDQQCIGMQIQNAGGLIDRRKGGRRGEVRRKEGKGLSW